MQHKGLSDVPGGSLVLVPRIGNNLALKGIDGQGSSVLVFVSDGSIFIDVRGIQSGVTLGTEWTLDIDPTEIDLSPSDRPVGGDVVIVESGPMLVGKDEFGNLCGITSSGEIVAPISSAWPRVRRWRILMKVSTSDREIYSRDT